jgi:hypothetical protein
MTTNLVKASSLESSFLSYWSIVQPKGVPAPEREIIFHATRKWRLDFGWRQLLLGVELQGTSFEGTHHQRTDGLINDYHKSNAAQLGGWTILQYTSKDLKVRPVQVIEEIAAEARRRIAAAESNKQSSQGASDAARD